MKDLKFHDLLAQACMENYLLESFSEEDFINLGLPLSTYPCITQGLPRDLDLKSPGFLQLKSGFNDIKVLKRCILDKPLLHLYNKAIVPNKQLILIITYVVPGGFGDFFAQRHLKKILKNHFSNLEIHSLIFMESTYSTKIDALSDESILSFDAIDACHPQYFDSATKKLLETASLIFEIPTQFPFQKELEDLCFLKDHYVSIGEYGFIQSQSYLPATSKRCLGLHYLEYGLFIDSLETLPLTKLHNPDITQFLQTKNFNNQNTSIHNFYFCYLATDYGSFVYFYLVIYLALHQKKSLDLICVDIGPFLKIIEKDLDHLKNLPIASIEIFYKNHKSLLQFSKDGIDIRIYHTGIINHHDFQILLANSQEPIGIRGNLSFSEAISLEKVFFYDPLTHNYPLYYELLSLANLQDKDVFCWVQLFKQGQDPHQAASQGAKLFQTPDFTKKFALLCAFIKQRLKTDEHMINIVYKALHQQSRPDIKKKEQILSALFIEKKLSFTQLIQLLRQEISS
jgi:hypothetical protein